MYTITPSVASEVVSQLEPKVIIPMHYQMGGLNPEGFAKLSGVEEFVKAVGITPQNLPSYQAKPETLPEETALVILERK